MNVAVSGSSQDIEFNFHRYLFFFIMMNVHFIIDL